MSKISQYSSTFVLIRGFFIALLSSAFIYLYTFELVSYTLNTLVAILAFALLLTSNRNVWFTSGAFIALFWFWWIGISFIHYQMPWVIPFIILGLMALYGTVFYAIAWLSEHLSSYFKDQLFAYLLKALALLFLSYIHPFSFDWYKPELSFVLSYFPADKATFTLILLFLSLSLWKRNPLFLIPLLFLLQTPKEMHNTTPPWIKLVTTQTPVEEKWDTRFHPAQFSAIFNAIDQAIKEEKKLIIFPESIFPIFLNRDTTLLSRLQKKSKKIAIVVGGLYWDGQSPKNSAYILDHQKIQIASKVILVPFGEANPLPNFLSQWVNRTFYDNAVDYKASKQTVDYTIDGKTYRNAICFEATSERLYEKGKNGNHPKNMIVLSNNGWFTPSIEPTLQKLLLLYYHRKYGTTIYHAINMSESYVIL
jgi:apolipoprotein N-acyltransferase